MDIISDISLAHGVTYRHGYNGKVRLCLMKLAHCYIYHTYLRTVAVGDDNRISVFNKVSYYFYRFLYVYHLFGKGIAQGVSSKGYNDFFHIFTSFNDNGVP